MLVSKTIAKYFYDMQIFDDLRTVAECRCFIATVSTDANCSFDRRKSSIFL
jgi:hypothetical protein